MKIGFSGTSSGMTTKQKESLRGLLGLLEAVQFHHGDCKGADDQAATIAHELKLRIICHPPFIQDGRANNPHSYEYREPKTHFARNRQIVEETDALVIAPWSAEHQGEGGTWYSHDYGVKLKKDVYIICPDGTVTCGGGTWPSKNF